MHSEEEQRERQAAFRTQVLHAAHREEQKLSRDNRRSEIWTKTFEDQENLRESANLGWWFFFFAIALLFGAAYIATGGHF